MEGAATGCVELFVVDCCLCLHHKKRFPFANQQLYLQGTDLRDFCFCIDCFFAHTRYSLAIILLYYHRERLACHILLAQRHIFVVKIPSLQNWWPLNLRHLPIVKH